MSWRDTILKDGVDRRVQGPRREMRLDKPPMRTHPKLRPNPVPDGYFKEKSGKLQYALDKALDLFSEFDKSGDESLIARIREIMADTYNQMVEMEEYVERKDYDFMGTLRSRKPRIQKADATPSKFPLQYGSYNMSRLKEDVDEINDMIEEYKRIESSTEDELSKLLYDIGQKIQHSALYKDKVIGQMADQMENFGNFDTDYFSDLQDYMDRMLE